MPQLSVQGNRGTEEYKANQMPSRGESPATADYVSSLWNYNDLRSFNWRIHRQAIPQTQLGVSKEIQVRANGITKIAAIRMMMCIPRLFLMTNESSFTELPNLSAPTQITRPHTTSQSFV